MNNVKFGLNQLAIRYSQPSANNFEEVLETSKIIPNYNLIEVSDDESEDSETEDDEEDEEEDDESIHSSDSSNSIGSDEFECNIKVLKLNILNEADLEECEMTLTCNLDESATKDDDKYLDELDDEIIEMAMKLPSSDELKTIAIDLGEEQVDYSKIPISKLKKIAVEKGIENVSKLKKQELIELLEVHL